VGAPLEKPEHPAMKCNLRFDTPPEILSDYLHEHGWTTQDLLAWWDALLTAFLLAGGWDMLPEAMVAAETEAWEMVVDDVPR
jgi:hypothetical protein